MTDNILSCIILLKDDICETSRIAHSFWSLDLRNVILAVEIAVDVKKRGSYHIPNGCSIHHTRCKTRLRILNACKPHANYPKAIDQLKERFGREDLLVQIYVRELLNLVMKNAVSGRTKTDLSTLYEVLEGKLRSLESLGRTQEKYGETSLHHW
ncbi:DUF1758 domain-containing protein [Trichonephila clavipes]|nr:DUF1758 domain-containing protein [Trichonephila clavipes]